MILFLVRTFPVNIIHVYCIQMYNIVIGEDDAFDVKSAVMAVAAKYRSFGGALGLRASELDKIHRDSHGSEEALDKVVDMWIAQSYNIKRFSHPSWRALVKTVESPAGGNNHLLARNIASKHPGVERIYSHYPYPFYYIVCIVIRKHSMEDSVQQKARKFPRLEDNERNKDEGVTGMMSKFLKEFVLKSV